MGIGIGMILATILMLGFNRNKELSKSQIEEKARSFGMLYEDECKVIFNKDVTTK
ncbi:MULTISPECIES: hypothetical protein [Clostridium]|uniref:Uncharacterized protein n=1 Tax=Clostridium paridis TaxID=2803863 RepID=A0A937FFN5_9CLOT|nr:MULTISPECIES: hypothetical protein [Clostridium]MBL4932949.1 hypothetical protein [Clostridium paridis]